MYNQIYRVINNDHQVILVIINLKIQFIHFDMFFFSTPSDLFEISLNESVSIFTHNSGRTENAFCSPPARDSFKNECAQCGV